MMMSHREATDNPGSGDGLPRPKPPARPAPGRGGGQVQAPASAHEVGFGLHSPPFQLLPDPRLYLQEGQYATVLTKLLDALEAGEPCLLLTGPPGTGKTAAAQRLQTLLDGSRWIVGTTFASSSTAGEDALLAAVQAFCLVGCDGPPAPVLDAWLSSQAAQGHRVLLVVDEAQRLEAAALRELAERMAPAASRPRLQLCLVGEQAPAALTGAQRDGSLPPVTVHCRLRALDASETHDYVLHRLRCAGWQGRPAFDPAALDAIHRLSEGIPGRLHLLADGVLLQLSNDSAQAATAATVQTAARLRTAELHDRSPIETEVRAAAPAASAAPRGRSFRPAAVALLLLLAGIGIVGSAWWLGDGSRERPQTPPGSTASGGGGLWALPGDAITPSPPAAREAPGDRGAAVADSETLRGPPAQPAPVLRGLPAQAAPASPAPAACVGEALALGLCEPADAPPPAPPTAPCEAHRAAFGLCER